MKPYSILIFTLLSFTLGFSAWPILSSAQEVTVAASQVPASTVPASQNSQKTTSPIPQTPDNQASSAPELVKPKLIPKKVIAPLPASSTPDLSVPVFAAKSYVLYDFSSQQTLLGNNANERIEPAALTKLMTAYVSFSALRFNKIMLKQDIQPVAEALRGESSGSGTSFSRMFLSRNKAVTVDELLHGLIVLSANDAARVLAAMVAGNETQFAAQMNIEAQRLN
ncbi:MAG: serine hydrolase, partial [Candidatus Nitrotoga sp.]